MIEPALTPEEWANRETSDAYVDRDGKLWCRSDCGGEPYAEDYEPNRLGLAALCLHGRITWEMVDALWATLAGYPGTLADAGGNRDWVGFDHLRALADLLESLMPPRNAKP